MADQELKAGMTDTPAKERRKWRLLLFLCLLQSAALILFAVGYAKLANATHQPAKTPRSASGEWEPFFQGRPGPWGNLEFVRINIDPPDEFVPIDDRLFEPTQWYFAGYDRVKLSEFFNGCGLTKAEQAQLPALASWIQTNQAVILTPSPKLILELNPASRAKIYSVLAEDPHNDFQFWPFTFRMGGFDDWFGDAKLSPATTALVKKLMYQRGDSLCFSDLPEIFPAIPDVSERRRLVKTLSRNASLLMRLKIKPDTDIDALTSYWASRGRKKDIRPLLDSLTDVHGGIGVDVAHLLPPFARKRLNTYPSPTGTNSDSFADCFWSALNFFNDPPDERYRNDAIWRKEIQEDYAVVPQATYGDLIFFLRPDGSPLHCAVYIADDVVFTKNGGNYRQPWILMKMEDLLARYPEPYAVRTVIYHPKTPDKPPPPPKA